MTEFSDNDLLGALRRALSSAPPKVKLTIIRGRLFRDIPSDGEDFYTVELASGAAPLFLRHELDEGDDRHVIEHVAVLPGRNFLPAALLPEGLAPEAWEHALDKVAISQPGARPKSRDPETVLAVRNVSDDTIMVGRQVMPPSPKARLILHEKIFVEAIPDLQSWLARGYVKLEAATPAQIEAAGLVAAAQAERKRSPDADILVPRSA